VAFHARREPVEHLAIERLSVELVEELLGVFLRDRVVARHDAGAPAGRYRCHQGLTSALRIRSSVSRSGARGVRKFGRTCLAPGVPKASNEAASRAMTLFTTLGGA
jgi:hypothetical protein